MYTHQVNYTMSRNNGKPISRYMLVSDCPNDEQAMLRFIDSKTYSKRVEEGYTINIESVKPSEVFYV